MKLSSSAILLVCVSTVAIATANEKAGPASMTTLRGGRHTTLRKGRHLKKKKSTETSQSSDDPQEGRNINVGGMKKKKKAKSKGKAKQDIQKTIATTGGAFSQISDQLKQFESKNVLGQGPLSLQPENPSTWTPPSSITQGEAKEDMPGDAETPGNIPEEGMPEKEGMPDVSMPEKEGMPDEGMPEKEGMPDEGMPQEGAGSGMPEDDMGGAPEANLPETETETTPEKDGNDNSIGAVATTPAGEGKPDQGAPSGGSPPEVVEVEPPAKTTGTTGATGTGGTSSGNAVAQRPLAVGANCDMNIPSLEAKENPATTDKKCKASCECDEECCIAWTFGSFCAARHPSKEGRAAFGGGYVKCMPLVLPSQ